MFFFASGFVAVEFLLDKGWHPIQLNFLRHILVISILIPLWIYWDGFENFLKANWRWGIFVGGLGFGCGSILLLYGQIFSDPVTITIILAVFPAVSGIVELIQDKRILNKEFVIGVAISIVGGCVAVLGSENLIKFLGEPFSLLQLFFYLLGHLEQMLLIFKIFLLLDRPPFV